MLVATTAHAAPCDELPVLATHGRIVVRGQLTRAQLTTGLALVDGVVADVHRRFGAGPAKTVTLCLLGDADTYTRVASEFGGDIPIGPFALIGDDSIGQGIVETLRGSRSRAVLMRNHGPFTIGKDGTDAVKAAVMVEEVARTVHISRQLGEPIPIDQAHIDALYDRYQNVYGQASATTIDQEIPS